MHIKHNRLWGNWKLPTDAVARVLEYLCQSGTPRLYTQLDHRTNRRSSVLANGKIEQGRYTMVDFYRMLDAGWIAFESNLEQGTESYAITDVGREALLQYRVWQQLRTRIPKLVEAAIREESARLSGTVPRK